MGVSKNRGTPKSSILIGFSIVNHPFWGTPIFGNTHIYIYIFLPTCKTIKINQMQVNLYHTWILWSYRYGKHFANSWMDLSFFSKAKIIIVFFSTGYARFHLDTWKNTWTPGRTKLPFSQLKIRRKLHSETSIFMISLKVTLSPLRKTAIPK